MNTEEILKLYYEIFNYMPVIWADKDSIKAFKYACDRYSKSWNKLSYSEQGLICEQIMTGQQKYKI